MRDLTVELGDAWVPIVDAVEDARHRLDRTTLLVGLAGAVGVGKSTAAAALGSALRDRGLAVEVVATDGFLLPNADLETRDLLNRKGFPETYDDALIVAVLDDLRHGRVPRPIPTYSHRTYDRVAGPDRIAGAADVVIVEGINALQSPARQYVDVGVYLHAEEDALYEWFLGRFLALCAQADADPEGGSFYRTFADDSEAERRATAERVWQRINAVNLHNHILPTREHADWVVVKDAEHRVLEVRRGT